MLSQGYVEWRGPFLGHLGKRFNRKMQLPSQIEKVQYATKNISDGYIRSSTTIFLSGVKAFEYIAKAFT